MGKLHNACINKNINPRPENKKPQAIILYMNDEFHQKFDETVKWQTDKKIIKNMAERLEKNKKKLGSKD